MKIVFLDRDGVIDKYPGDTSYVTAWGEFHFLPGVKEAMGRLTQVGYKIFIVSNQAGVAKGLYTKNALDDITNKMLQELESSGAAVEGVYYCLHRDEDNCSCRKPKAGLLEKALQEHNIPKGALKGAFFVGDSIRDIQAGKSAGCKTILVFSGKEKPGSHTVWSVQPDFTARDLPEAVDLILGTSFQLNTRVSPD
jgi:histidinol-phosphate phosphatase family protein